MPYFKAIGLNKTNDDNEKKMGVRRSTREIKPVNKYVPEPTEKLITQLFGAKTKIKVSPIFIFYFCEVNSSILSSDFAEKAAFIATKITKKEEIIQG